MIDFFKKVFGNDAAHDSSPAVDKETRLLTATCALFVELAKADGEFSKKEQELIVQIFQDKYGLSESDAKQLIIYASEQIERSVDIWTFTNQINQNFSQKDKKEIAALLWRIVFVDGELSSHEDNLTRKLCKLLNLSHSEFIEAKLLSKPE